MTISGDSQETLLAKSSLWGVIRGVLVHSLIYPLEVIKVRQQLLESSGSTEKSTTIARRILQTEGPFAFYRGLTPQLIKTSVKQIWCWPLMTAMPLSLRRFELGDTTEMALTGLSVAALDAGSTSPLEKMKILSMLSRRSSPLEIFRKGWEGLNTLFLKQSASWVTFLVAQKHFRDKEREISPSGEISLSALVRTGVKVAAVVSVVVAPFDVANTFKQSGKAGLWQFFSEISLRRMYRGWPMHATSLVVHNIASVSLMEAIGQTSRNTEMQKLK